MTDTVHGRILDVAERRGDGCAIDAGSTSLSYAELARCMRGIAGLINGHDAVAGPLVIWLPAGPLHIATHLGCFYADRTAVPLDMRTPPRRLAAMLETLSPAAILTDAAHETGLSDVLQAAGATVPIQQVDLSSSAGLTEAVPGHGADVAYIMFTSGSTGTPKAIGGTHAGLLHFLDWEIAEFGLDTASRVSLLAAPSFDVSLRDIFAPLLAGGTVCVPSERDRTRMRALLDWLAAAAVTHVHCVPTLFRALMAELQPGDRDALRALQRVLLAGEALYREDVSAWRDAMGDRIELVNLYGPTETTLAKVYYRIGGTLPETANGTVPIGRPLPGVDAVVMAAGKPLAEGEIGEIHIRPPFACPGYYGDPELTASRFVADPQADGEDGGFFRTGDMGSRRPDGDLEFLGRLDGQIKLHGIRMEFGEIEHALRAHPAVTAAAAAVKNDGANPDCLVGYFTSNETVSVDALRTHLEAYLPGPMLPAFLVPLRSLPVNLHGKVDRQALPMPEALLYEDGDCVVPVTPTEAKVEGIWADMLGAARVSVDRAFLELGGDSLKAFRTIGELYKAFGVELSLRIFLEHDSVRELAAWIDGQQARKGDG